MQIKVYGTGCSKCKALYENVQTALDVAGIDVEIEKVTDLQSIAQSGILMTPALEINGKVVASGRVLEPKEIYALLPEQETACSGEECSCCSCHCSPNGHSEDACACGTQEKTEPSTPACHCGKSAAGKRLLAYIIITIALVGLAVMLVREQRTAPSVAIEDQVSRGMTVYYFHGNVRCKTCNAFEQLTREVLQNQFQKELSEGEMVFQVVNVDENANSHFVTDFGLTTKSVVLFRQGQYKNLDQIWTQIRQGDDVFKSYIADSIRSFIAEQR